jgi:hypothetical protein
MPESGPFHFVRKKSLISPPLLTGTRSARASSVDPMLATCPDQPNAKM